MLGFARRSAPAADLGCGVFGKIVSSADFVSAGEYSPAAAHLTHWLEEGVGWAATQAKEAWESLGSSSPRAFLFRPDRSKYVDRVIFGLIKPSRDSVGRHFPFVVYAELSLGSDVDGYSVLPLVVGEFLERAAEVLEHATHGADPRPLLQQAPHRVAARMASCKSEFAEWAARTDVSTVFAALFGDPWEAQARNVLSSLHAIAAPFVGKELPDTPLSVRLPLGSAGIAGAVFWLEVLRKVQRCKRTVPICFWHTYVDAGQLVVALGDPTMRSLLGLWVDNGLDDSLCDLSAGSPAFGELPAKLADALAKNVKVAELLAAI